MKQGIDWEYRICSNQGTYIVAANIGFEAILEKRPLVLEGLRVEVGEFTTVHDFNCRPIKFCGFLGNDAIFFLGLGAGDLFNEPCAYYDVISIIQENRIGKSYKAGTFRDVFLRKKANGEYFWK